MMRAPIRPSALRLVLAGGVAATALLTAGAALALPVAGAGPYAVSPGGGQPIIATNANAVRVDLNAPRTIIDWQSFNLAGGERADFLFDQRNWIVLNRVTGSAISINGTVFGGQQANFNSPPAATPGGNVWFYSPQGVAFGASARVDVGGMLATSAAVNTAAFLNATNLNINFTGSGSGGPVTVAAGAAMTGTAHLAFIAPSVTTRAGSNFTVSDYGSVLYGGADSFEVQMFPTFNDDLTIFTFILPSAAAGTPITNALNIAGATQSGTIYLAAYSRAALASEMINAPGLLVARSSFAAYGQVTITTGRNIILGQPGPGEDGPLANLNTGLTVGSARIGEINADGNVNVILTGVDYDKGPLGNLNATKIRAGQGLVIGGNVINIPGGVSAGDTGLNFGSASVVAGAQLTIPTITARTDLFFGSRFNGVTFDRATSGGNLSILSMQTVAGNLLSSVGNLTVSSGGPVNVARVSGGAVSLSVANTVNIAALVGSSSVTTGTSGAQTYGSVTGGTVALSTSSTISAATLSGSSIDLGSTGGQTIGSATGGSVIFRSNGLADIGSVATSALTINASSVRLGAGTVSGDAVIRTQNLELLTSFAGRNLNIEGIAGRFRLGGTEEPGLTNAELQRITLTGALNLYAGQREPSNAVPNPLYGDFEVLDLTLDAARIPRLNLFAHTDRKVSVLGTVRVTGSGAALQIGDPTAGSAWLPSRIVITGSVGTALGDPVTGFTEVQAFDLVQLYAKNDILMGSSRFIDLIDPVPAAEIDIARGLPAGVAATGEEIGHLFLVAGKAQMTAEDRIVQQNSGPVGQEAGIYLTGQGVDGADALLEIGKAKVADLFGAIATDTGITFGKDASFSARIGRIEGDGAAGFIRINGCPLGVGCALSGPATQFRIESFRPAETRAAIDPPVLSPPPAVDEDERDSEAVVTGTGNEEIWRTSK